MGSNNPLLRSNQNLLVAKLQRNWQNTIRNIWDEEGPLFISLSDSYLIHKSIPKFSDKLHDHTKNTVKELDILRTIENNRRKLLEVPETFFKSLLRCNDYSEINSNDNGLDLKLPPEHFAWATNVLLSKFFRMNEEQMSTLMENLENSEYYECYKNALLEDLEASKVQQLKLENIKDKQIAFANRLNDETIRISDYDFFNIVYGISLLDGKNEDSRERYLQANDVVIAYLDQNPDKDNKLHKNLKNIYTQIIQFLSYRTELKTLLFSPDLTSKLPVSCRTSSNEIDGSEVTAEIKQKHTRSFKETFDIELLELEKRLQNRLHELKNIEEKNLLLTSLKQIELEAITESLTLIATYRCTVVSQNHLGDIYQSFNEDFTQLLEGKINEIEFEARVNHLIKKYTPDQNILKKLITYIIAIIDFLTGKDKNQLPALLNVEDLKKYAKSFRKDFINYLNKLSFEAKEKFIQDYADKLELKLADLSSEKNTPRAETQKSTSEKSSSGTDSSQPPAMAPLITKFRSFHDDISDSFEKLVEEARELESALISASAAA